MPVCKVGTDALFVWTKTWWPLRSGRKFFKARKTAIISRDDGTSTDLESSDPHPARERSVHCKHHTRRRSSQHVALGKEPGLLPHRQGTKESACNLDHADWVASSLVLSHHCEDLIYSRYNGQKVPRWLLLLSNPTVSETV